MGSSTFVFIVIGSSLFVQAVLAAIVANLAKKRGRSAAGYFWLSFLFTFLVGLIVLLIQTSGTQSVRLLNVNSNIGLINGEKHIKCPSCAEWVKLEAQICKHCGNDLSKHIQVTLAAEEESVRFEAQKAIENRIARIEATKLWRANLFRNRLFQAACGTGAVLIAVGVFITLSKSSNIEDAKKPADITEVKFDFEHKNPHVPFCPTMWITYDTSKDETKKSILDSMDDGDYRDNYRVVFPKNDNLNFQGNRELIDNPQSLYLEDDFCREMALSNNSGLSFNISASNYWYPDVVEVFSGVVEVPWVAPNYRAQHNPFYGENSISIEPDSFAGSATDIEFPGLTTSESKKLKEAFIANGSLWVDKGEVINIKLINPAGSQSLTLTYGM